MTKITNRKVDKSYEIYLSLYQAVSGNEEEKNIYKQFSSDFFDLVVVDECHRGSAAEDAAWKEILTHFSSATQVGLTATPKETKDVSNIDYFGEPVYLHSLKQGIQDGFLAPYKVIRYDLDRDYGYRPEKGKVDANGILIEDRIYNVKDYDRKMVLVSRTELVARKISEFLNAIGPMSKTIVFCQDINHAERMRSALVNLHPKEAQEDSRYVMHITGDENIGKAELDNFIDPESTHPVIACTSKLMTTGVDERVVIVPDEVQEAPELYKKIDEETVEELDVIPTQYFRRIIVREKYVLIDDREAAPIVAPAPERLIPNSYASTGLVAQIILNKYCDHLPLYRQEWILKYRFSIEISRKTMGNWMYLTANWLCQVECNRLG